jgi:hypothetical protein
MADDKVFARGIFFREPREGAPEFAKGRISINVNDAIPFLEENCNADGWVNLHVKMGRNGKLYVEKNSYQPHERREPLRDTRPVEYPKDDINPDDLLAYDIRRKYRPRSRVAR